MSYAVDLCAGIAEFLAAQGLATWRADGAYVPTDYRPIFYSIVPATAGDAITLTSYGVSDSFALSSSTIGLQVRVRGAGRNPAGADRIGDDIFNVLHGAQHVELSTGIHVSGARRVSSISLGQAPSGDWARSDNYYLDAHRPSANRI